MLTAIQNSDNWKNAFLHANLNSHKNPRIDLEDVEVVLASSNGDGMDHDWIGVFILKSGQFLYIEAGYDADEHFPAWDATSGGDMIVSDGLEEIIDQMGDSSRARLHRQLEPFVPNMVIIRG